MQQTVKIVTYHYVRDLSASRYPEIKGLSVPDFERQLDYLASDHTFISMEELITGFEEPRSLPERPVLLTFDDGYIDHYDFVFPSLDRRGIPGAFYLVSSVLEGREVLDVNKIHFVLASAPVESVVTYLFSTLDTLRGLHDLPSAEKCYDLYATPSRWDTAEVAMVKRLLQHGLVDSVRRLVLDRLFAEFVAVDEATFARELYMDESQVQCLLRHGMHIGSHGHMHRRLDVLSQEERERELDVSVRMLRRLGVAENSFTFCYPFGSWNEAAAAAVADRKFVLALGLSGEDAVVTTETRFAVSRVDTNQIPS